MEGRKKVKGNNLFKIVGLLLFVFIISACGLKEEKAWNVTDGKQSEKMPKPEEYLRSEYWLFEDLGP
jgi:predicted small lipoprotein YifL